MNDSNRVKKCLHILFVWGITLFTAMEGESFAQSLGGTPEANPIVDPLSEMTPPDAGAEGEANDGILDMDIERLGSVEAVVPAFDIKVSSVAKQESTIGKSPAAVFVITSEMIHRSGATCIPEALRLAPGVTVCKIDAYEWSVSIRGFNDLFSNKLLVMIDGRSVYNAIFSGVFWNYIDMPMDNIDRIEVIRGPGGTLWGNNAVNGVINVITKNAEETQGAYVSSGGGSVHRNISTVRYGGKIGEHAKYNVWGKYREEGPEMTMGRHDDWRQGRGGFRVDWNPGGSKNDLVTTQGNFFGGEEGFAAFSPYVGNQESSLQARWEHTIDEESNWALQTYYDQLWRDDTSFSTTLNTFCTDFQHRFPVGDRHHIIWGVEYLRVQNYFVAVPGASRSFSPEARLVGTTSWFVQDDIEVIEDKFDLTVGTKLENNCYTGFEYQPSIRGLWQFDNRHVMWAAISRAVRTPSLTDDSGYMTQMGGFMPSPTISVFNPNDDLKSEDMMAYELGYRVQATKRFSWDLALFYNVYRNLLYYKEGTSYVDPPFTYDPYTLENGGRGEAYGFEWTANWEATKNWTLAGSYSYLFHQDYYDVAPGQDYYLAEGCGAYDPKNQIRLQSYWSFASHWQLDGFLRYVDPVAPHFPSYVTMDLRLGWRPRKNLEFSIVGQNLFDQYHPEMFGVTGSLASAVGITRSVFAKVTWTR